MAKAIAVLLSPLPEFLMKKVRICCIFTFTSAVSLRLVRDCRKRSVPVVFSYHTPTASC